MSISVSLMQRRVEGYYLSLAILLWRMLESIIELQKVLYVSILLSALYCSVVFFSLRKDFCNLSMKREEVYVSSGNRRELLIILNIGIYWRIYESRFLGSRFSVLFDFCFSIYAMRTCSMLQCSIQSSI